MSKLYNCRPQIDELLRNPPGACQVKTIINMTLKTKAKNKLRQIQHWLRKIP